MKEDIKILKITKSNPLPKSIEKIKEYAKISLKRIEDFAQRGQIIADAIDVLSYTTEEWDDMPGAEAVGGLGRALSYMFKKIEADLPDLEGGIEALQGTSGGRQ